MKLAPAFALAALAFAPSTAVVIPDLATAKWTHEKNDPPGSESVFLREDTKTGGMEMLVRFPAGHVIAPHWHTANERIIVLEGRMTLRVGEAAGRTLETGVSPR